jgi:ribosomal subunit interface protein
LIFVNEVGWRAPKLILYVVREIVGTTPPDESNWGKRMQVPVQVVFEHIEHSDAIDARVRQEAEKLERYYDRITSLRVVVARSQHRHHKGDAYSVDVILSVPGGPDIAVSQDSAMTGRHEDILVAIRDAFDAARRRLQDFVRERQDQERG